MLVNTSAFTIIFNLINYEMSFKGVIKRADLNLRGEYPQMSTSIYQISDSNFVIYCQNVGDNFQDIVENFNHSIRPISVPVTVVKEAPLEFQEIIDPIEDSAISKGFEGMYLSAVMLFNLLLSKFPSVRFYKIETVQTGVKIFTARHVLNDGQSTTHKFLSIGERSKVENFLKGMNLPFDFEVVDQHMEEEIDDFPQYEFDAIQFLHSSRLRKNNGFEFSKRDESLWFDNVDKIFEGSFKKNDLYFYNEKNYSCYVDFSIFTNIDLRNHLLLFQVVYLTPPFETKIEKWLKEANILKKEFLDLIKKGRIKLVLTQMESRYDLSFLMEAYEACPDAVITRRALAALQQTDIVSISDNYIFNDPDVLNQIGQVCALLGQETGVDSRFLMEMLTWPIKARRQSFEALHQKGTFGTSIFGINNLLERKISEQSGKDRSFEFTMFSSSIHLSNALEATYFPFGSPEDYSDQFYACLMGDFLNFYKCATGGYLNSYAENDIKAQNGVIQINPIDIIRVNDFISVTELEKEIDRFPTFSGGKLLMETLALLTEDERTEKVAHYNNEIVKKLNKGKINPNTIDLVTSVALDGLGMVTGNPLIGTAFSTLKFGGNTVRQSAVFEKFNNKIQSAMQDADRMNIRYLDKISRVARIKAR
ncbi:hypothetical protein FLGSB24_19610 [Flavobacterium sp. GSB-24]|nr:hypothetical protein FLGSB24_19610 [Flavobacterium sp. GSB-24]